MVRTSFSSGADGIPQTEVGRLPMASPCVTCNQEVSRLLRSVSRLQADEINTNGGLDDSVVPF